MMLSPGNHTLIDLTDDAWAPYPAMIFGKPPLTDLTKLLVPLYDAVFRDASK